jgi:hypothetical protein
MDDNLIEETKKAWEIRGYQWTPETGLQNFALYGPEKRAQAMEQMESRMADATNAREAADLITARRQHLDLHNALLEVGK